MDKYQKMHEALKTQQEGNTTARQLVGDNVEYFAKLNNKKLHKDKFEMLKESLMLTFLQNHNYKREDHLLIRLGIESILDAFEMCENDVEQRNKK